jgi:hypothetical protein
MYHGFHSGLRWGTKGSTVTTQQGPDHTNRYLLHFPGSFQIVKAIKLGLGDTKKGFVSVVLADLYNYASQNVKLCEQMKPQEFFALVKAQHDWSKGIDPDIFWRFT